VQSRRDAAVGVNPITAKNNTVITLHLNDEERGSERLAPYGELHGDDTLGPQWVAPYVVKHKVSLHDLVVLPSKILEDGVRHQVDCSAAIDEHCDRSTSEMRGLSPNIISGDSRRSENA
jgi:hypothetical protein